MAEKLNATCSICGNKYHMCLSCKDQMNINPWKIHTDTAEHYKVFQVIRGFNTGVYNKAEAKEKLGNIDLSDIDTFRDNIRDIVRGILQDDVRVNVEDTKEDVAEVETDAVEKFKSRRRRNIEVAETAEAE